MYSFLVAAIKPKENYDWHVYNGKKPVQLDFRGKPVEVTKGTKFGVRPSANAKNIRLIFPGEETRVFTITREQAQQLSRGIDK